MARYRTSVRSDRPAEEAFAFVADLGNLTEWDPGVTTATRVAGDGVGPESAYEVTLSAPKGYGLRYETTAFDVPDGPDGAHAVTLEARSRLFTSIDRISAEADGDGSVVTYDAELKLNGILALGDLGLRLAFGRIGDRAAAGLRKALDGEFVT